MPPDAVFPPMMPVRTLFRSGRALAGFLLLATLLVGEVADAQHHLSEHGCAAESGGRDDNCTCGSMHAGSLASEAPAQAAPIAHERAFTLPARAAAPRGQVATAAVPRAPPTA